MAYLAAFALCLLAFRLTSGTPVVFTDCGSQMSKLTQVDINPCPGQPCKLKRGTEESIQVSFIPNENITTATTKVYGQVGGVKLPFALAQDNACKDQGIVCPMAPGKPYTFKTTLPIKSVYPTIEVIVIWKMMDQNRKTVYCWAVPVEIV